MLDRRNDNSFHFEETRRNQASPRRKEEERSAYFRSIIVNNSGDSINNNPTHSHNHSHDVYAPPSFVSSTRAPPHNSNGNGKSKRDVYLPPPERFEREEPPPPNYYRRRPLEATSVPITSLPSPRHVTIREGPPLPLRDSSSMASSRFLAGISLGLRLFILVSLATSEIEDLFPDLSIPNSNNKITQILDFDYCRDDLSHDRPRGLLLAGN